MTGRGSVRSPGQRTRLGTDAGLDTGLPKDAKGVARGAANCPRIVLAYGEQDLFAATPAELRAHLLPADTLTTPGAPVWGSWRVLLERIAQRDLLNPPGPNARQREVRALLVEQSLDL